jgi:hypothetical protein
VISTTRATQKKELLMSQFEDTMSHVDQDAVANLTMEMIDIPSPMGGERALAEYLAGRFRAVAAGMRREFAISVQAISRNPGARATGSTAWALTT